MSDQSALLIALVGGVGGALLAGIFQAVTGALSQRTQQRHELDAWLRQQRMVHFTTLLEKFYAAGALMDPVARGAAASDIHEASVAFQIVVPESLDPVVRRAVKAVTEELSGDWSVRSSQAIAWEGGHFSGHVKTALGWGQEPVTRRRRRPLRRMFLRIRDRIARAR